MDYMYRGCVTPKVIGHILESLREMNGGKEDKIDYTDLDGYDELPEELQDKVRRALEQGHVDDADWKGV